MYVYKFCAECLRVYKFCVVKINKSVIFYSFHCFLIFFFFRAVTYTFFTAFTKNENERSSALCCCGCVSCSVVPNVLQPHGL